MLISAQTKPRVVDSFTVTDHRCVAPVPCIISQISQLDL